MPTNQESLASAIVNVGNYVDFTANNNLRNYAFTISAIELFEALGMSVPTPPPSFGNIRIYLGIDNSTGEFKLYITPVTGNVNVPGLAGNDFILPDNEQGSNAYVLELIYPCPNTCDVTSPLYYGNV